MTGGQVVVSWSIFTLMLVYTVGSTALQPHRPAWQYVALILILAALLARAVSRMRAWQANR
jgi:hypothetical protein